MLITIITSININIRYCSYYRYLKLKLKASLMRSNVSKSLLFLLIKCNISSVQFSRSVMSDFLWPPWTAARQALLSTTNSWSLLKLMSIPSVMPSNHLMLCQPLILLPSIFSSIRVFSHESVLHIRWPKYWSFSISISLSNKYSGLISFKIDWLDLEV